MSPKKPGTGGTVAKIIVAALFFIVAPDTEGSTVLVSVVIAFAFLAWAVFPYRRYRQEAADAAAGRVTAAKRPGVGLTVVKTAMAAIFIVMAFDMEERSELLISLVMGAACLFWAFLPYRRYRQAAAREAEITQAAAENGKTAAQSGSNPAVFVPTEEKARYCPYCGAPKRGDRCEYCGM